MLFEMALVLYGQKNQPYVINVLFFSPDSLTRQTFLPH